MRKVRTMPARKAVRSPRLIDWSAQCTVKLERHEDARVDAGDEDRELVLRVIPEAGGHSASGERSG
jgi:hypothetical protein